MTMSKTTIYNNSLLEIVVVVSLTVLYMNRTETRELWTDGTVYPLHIDLDPSGNKVSVKQPNCVRSWAAIQCVGF